MQIYSAVVFTGMLWLCWSVELNTFAQSYLKRCVCEMWVSEEQRIDGFYSSGMCAIEKSLWMRLALICACGRRWACGFLLMFACISQTVMYCTLTQSAVSLETITFVLEVNGFAVFKCEGVGLGTGILTSRGWYVEFDWI